MPFSPFEVGKLGWTHGCGHFDALLAWFMEFGLTELECFKLLGRGVEIGVGFAFRIIFWKGLTVKIL